MISNEIVQAALVTTLKANILITTLLSGGADEIREDQWQGTTFTYPAIRVDLGRQVPEICDVSRQRINILCFSENASSKEADILAGTVNSSLDGRVFVMGSFRFSMIASAGLIPAIRQDERTWRSEATFDLLIEPI